MRKGEGRALPKFNVKISTRKYVTSSKMSRTFLSSRNGTGVSWIVRPWGIRGRVGSGDKGVSRVP